MYPSGSTSSRSGGGEGHLPFLMTLMAGGMALTALPDFFASAEAFCLASEAFLARSAAASSLSGRSSCQSCHRVWAKRKFDAAAAVEEEEEEEDDNDDDDDDM